MTFSFCKMLSDLRPVITPDFGVNVGHPWGKNGTCPVITPRCDLPGGVKTGHGLL